MVDDKALRPVLGSILRGYQKSNYAGKTVYYKHLSLVDFCDIESVHTEYYERAIREGIYSEKDQLAMLVEKGEWTEEKENEIKFLEEQIKMDLTTKALMAIPSQVRAKQKEIDENEQKLVRLKTVRYHIMGLTAEQFATKKNNEFYVYRSAYKDKDCLISFFNEEEFDELEPREVDDLIVDYNKSFSEVNLKNIQRIAFSLHFQDTFKVAGEHPYYFFGRWVKELSRFQIELFFEARRFVNMLQSGDHPPEDIISDPDKLIEWFDTTKNAKELVKGDGNVSLVGATKQDLKELGLDDGQKSMVEILRARDPNKKTFSMHEAMNIHGQGA